MKKLLFFLFSLFLCVRLYAIDPLQVKVIRLSNGFTVWLNEDHSRPTVFGAVVVKAGAKDCPNTGIAHYFEHILFKGTDRIGTTDFQAEKPLLDSITAQYDLLAKTIDAQQRLQIQHHINHLSIRAAQYAIPNEFTTLITTYGGSKLNAYTSFDETVFHNFFTPQYLRQWCMLNAERLISPVFRLFQGELETVYEEKNMYSDHFMMPILDAVQSHALAGTPYAYSILGSTENLKNPQLSEMYKFYKTYYVAGNMGLILSGDVRTEGLRDLLEQTFGRISPGVAPESPRSVLRNFRGERALKVKVPFPIIKGLGYAYKAPSEQSKDFAAFEVMKEMFSNDSHTGMLDSLVTTHRLLEARAGGYHFKDFSVFGFLMVPRIPFGSKRIGTRQAFTLLQQLKHGDFSDEQLRQAKLMLKRQLLMSLENVETRRSLMINAFSHGIPWSDVLDRANQFAHVTRKDVMHVAQTYINDDSLKLVKTFGHYPKDRLKQPGYRPVQPPHIGAHSAYARSLDTLSHTQLKPKSVDFKHDVTTRSLSPLVRLYASPNPFNDISQLKLVFRRGTLDNPKIEVLADYLSQVGTVELTKEAFGQAMNRLGGSFTIESSDYSFVITLTVFDEQLDAGLALLSQLLEHPRLDPKAMHSLVRDRQLSNRTFLKNNNDIASAIWKMMLYGKASPMLRRVSLGELKRLKPDTLVTLLNEVMRYQLDVEYVGNVKIEQVEQTLRRYVDLAQVTHPCHIKEYPMLPVHQPTVYFYDLPRARQTILGTYQQIGALTTPQQQAAFSLWAAYFGKGMSSVLFQNIREFRSLAYSVYGQTLHPTLWYDPRMSCGYITYVGTQGDKAMSALGELEHLIHDMPLNVGNVVTARSEMVNAMSSIPSFRSLPGYVAKCHLLGFTSDPKLNLLEPISSMTPDEVMQFYREKIQCSPCDVLVVGDHRLMNMEKLKSLGKVVVLKTQDFYTK